MRWRKLGLVYGPDGGMPWAASHAMLPTPLPRRDGTLRVFVTFCDAGMVGRPGYVDIDSRDVRRVRRISREPLLDIGAPGTFDENGVAALSVVQVEPNVLFMYYVGFELGTKIRYRLLTGLAISEDGGESFRRASVTPVLERSDAELYFRCGPHVIKDRDRFRMWYVAGSEWTMVDGKPVPVYEIRYAESDDGRRWPASGSICLAVSGPDEHGFGRPWIVRDDRGYRMFYSIRRRSLGAYRLGYAESDDGLVWQRDDRRLGLDVSASGWDSQAVMYAATVSAEGRTYAFYNGNEFGRAGFGAALLEEA